MLKIIILSSHHLPELLLQHCTTFLRARNISQRSGGGTPPPGEPARGVAN